LKFFLDNCVCPHFSTLLKAFGIDVQSVQERYGHDPTDPIWIPEICKEGRIIITGDRAQMKGRGKTIVECRLYQKHRGIAYFLPPACTNAMRWRQTTIFFRCWEKIIEHAATAKRGQVFDVSATAEIVQKHVRKVS
jgi:hypothetical protein